METTAAAWSEKFRALSDCDPTIQCMARYFTCSYMLDMGEFRAIIRVIDGRITELNTDPAPLDAYDFAIRARAETWRKFGSPTPPPMCHGIWAATFREGMTLEGNILALMQNLRNITVQLELLRQTGVPA